MQCLSAVVCHCGPFGVTYYLRGMENSSQIGSPLNFPNIKWFFFLLYPSPNLQEPQPCYYPSVFYVRILCWWQVTHDTCNEKLKISNLFSPTLQLKIMKILRRRVCVYFLASNKRSDVTMKCVFSPDIDPEQCLQNMQTSRRGERK